MKDILIAARAKIADPAHWTQHVLARDANGNDKPDSHPLSDHIHWEGLTGDDPMACRWCAIGAVQAVTPDKSKFNAARQALNQAAKKLFGIYSIAEVNDELAHIDVLAVFDEAIAQL